MRPAEELLLEALGLERSTPLRTTSAEPLGRGLVTGIQLAHEGETLHYFVDTSGVAVDQETGLVSAGPEPDGATADAGRVPGADAPARIWLHPADPHLPPLLPMAFEQSAAALLQRFGLTLLSPPVMLVYRAGKRAVLSVETSEHGRLFVKVLLQRRVERVHALHKQLLDAGIPVPKLLGWSRTGLLLLEAAKGTAGERVLLTRQTGEILAAIDALRDTLASAEVPVSERASLGTRTEWYRDRLHETSLDRRALDDATKTLERASRDLKAAPEFARRAIHGDLHISQLFFGASGASSTASTSSDPQGTAHSKPGPLRVTGMIDVDTVGLGDPADDDAAFIGHAFASSLLVRDAMSRSRWESLAWSALERWEPLHGVRTRALLAIHCVAHALGAAASGDHGKAETLIGAARHLLDRDDEGAKERMRAFSSPAPLALTDDPHTGFGSEHLPHTTSSESE
ncbi:phosphotransferase [Humidisolicoccus flavus]|uniref:phosphotransferase n=1 Tax=Humidisolicoccus flavus TaxID=3111414 RepID=UPI00324E9A70